MNKIRAFFSKSGHFFHFLKRAGKVSPHSHPLHPHTHLVARMTKEEYTAFLSLKSNNNIIIQKADKRNTAVILNRVSYVFGIIAWRYKLIHKGSL